MRDVVTSKVFCVFYLGLGSTVGSCVGGVVGKEEGMGDGRIVGCALVGTADGCGVGFIVGLLVGFNVGEAVGLKVPDVRSINNKKKNRRTHFSRFLHILKCDRRATWQG